MADPTVLPPQFVGKYPGAPLPVPLPVAPSQFVSRLPTGAPGTTSGAVPAFQPVQAAIPAAPVAPVAAAALPPANALMPATGPMGTQVMVPQPGAPVAPSLRAASLVAGLPTYNPSTNAVQPVAATAAGGDGQQPPPLPPEMMDGQGGGFQDNTLWSPGAPNGPATTGLPAYAGGAAGAGGAGGGSGVGRLIDPDAAQQRGYDRQLAYQQASINNLLSAFSRSDGLAATKHALAAAVGLNDFGQVGGQGANALNQSTAGITEAETNAAAQRYTSDQNLQGKQAEIGEQHYQAGTQPVPIGGRIDTSAGYGIVVPTYGSRAAQVGGMPTPLTDTVQDQGLPPGLKVGAPYKGADGVYNLGSKKVTVQNGQVTGIQ